MIKKAYFENRLKTIGNATLLAYDQSKPVIVTDPWLNDHSAYFGSWTLGL